jgi:hypothetical protein
MKFERIPSKLRHLSSKQKLLSTNFNLHAQKCPDARRRGKRSEAYWRYAAATNDDGNNADGRFSA